MDPTKNDNHVKWYCATQVILSAAHMGERTLLLRQHRFKEHLFRSGQVSQRPKAFSKKHINHVVIVVFAVICAFEKEGYKLIKQERREGRQRNKEQKNNMKERQEERAWSKDGMKAAAGSKKQ